MVKAEVLLEYMGALIESNLKVAKSMEATAASLEAMACAMEKMSQNISSLDKKIGVSLGSNAVSSLLSNFLK